jgi:hypothetical protein
MSPRQLIGSLASAVIICLITAAPATVGAQAVLILAGLY